MKYQFDAILSILIPQVVALIAEKEELNDIAAINEFYQSEVYSVLSKEETKLWHYSPMMLYTMYKDEKETGVLSFPEDQL